MEEKHVCSITPEEFEKYCLEILSSYAEEENLKDFLITHNKHIPVQDGTYQIDVYAEFTALGTKIKVLCECKQYTSSVNREKVSSLHQKLTSIGAQKGILLSTGKFQSGAIKYAKVHGIALIHVDDYNFDYISHSSGETILSEDDPFQYMEQHMPPYVAYSYTAEETPQKVYPPRAMLKELLLEQCRLIKEKLGIDIDISKELESVETNYE